MKLSKENTQRSRKRLFLISQFYSVKQHRINLHLELSYESYNDSKDCTLLVVMETFPCNLSSV